MGGFFLVSAEAYSLRLQQNVPWGVLVILPDGRKPIEKPLKIKAFGYRNIVLPLKFKGPTSKNFEKPLKVKGEMKKTFKMPLTN